MPPRPERRAGRRFFTTTGPVKPDRHYCIPPLDRLDLDDVLALVGDEKYFVLHAPRQTGKTSALLALRDRLNADGYRCVYVNVEVGQTAREDIERAMRTVLGRLASQARMTLGDEFLDGVFRDLLARYAPDDVLLEALTRWAETDARPLVLLIDEIDMLIGDSLLAVLRQLRTGVPPAPAQLSAERGALRGAGRAGLPDPLRLSERAHRRGQRVQRQGRVVAAG